LHSDLLARPPSSLVQVIPIEFAISNIQHPTSNIQHPTTALSGHIHHCPLSLLLLKPKEETLQSHNEHKLHYALSINDDVASKPARIALKSSGGPDLKITFGGTAFV
jgi:hypothetical protein